MRKTTTPADPAAEPSDEDLFRRFRDGGDDRAFELLVYRYERPLFSHLRRLLHSDHLAEEVFQATFLRVHVKRDSFDTGRRFQPWLYTVATRQAIDAMRRERRHARRQPAAASPFLPTDGTIDDVPASGRTPAEQAGDYEERQRVRAAVGRLSAVQRRAVQLVYEQGLAYREAAGMLGVPIGTLKSRLHAAIASLGGSWA